MTDDTTMSPAPDAPRDTTPAPTAEPSVLDLWDAGAIEDDAPVIVVSTAPAPAAVTPELGAEPAPPAAREQDHDRDHHRKQDQERPAAPPQSRRSRDEAPAAAAPVDEDYQPTFEDLGLSGALLRSIKDVGYDAPTPIQTRTLPVLLAGDDLIAQAQTGSGKTAAFGLPIIETIDPRLKQVQALILCPTRELAIQVAEALHKYGRHKEVETLPIYGGQPYERQFRGLQRGVQIVVGTPGRVMDHMRRGTLNLEGLRFFVLDEADEMLDMGFVEDIEWILEHSPVERQTALFSATMPPRIADLAQRYLQQPKRISIAGKQMTVAETEQSFYEVPRARKLDALTRILDAETPTSAMIFCRTKLGVDELGEALQARGYMVETLHGDLSQVQRDRVMRRFRGGQADILIATDVAARGLDIPEVSHVINYDPPESAEAYVHRIGRTGRAGRTGAAITLVTPREVRWMRQIERVTKATIQGRRLPTVADVAERRRELLKQQVLDMLARPDDWRQYVDTIDDLAEERDAVDIAAAVLKLYADETGRGTPDQVEDDIATFSAATAPRARGETGMVRLFLNVGRNQNIRPQDIVGAIANEAGIPGRAIGAIDILDAYSFVDIPAEFVERVLGVMSTSSIKGRRVNIEVARPGDAGAPDARGPRPGYQDRRSGPGGPNGPRRESRPPTVGGGRVSREGDEQRPPGPPRGDQGGRRFDRTGPARFRVRREDER